MSQQSSVRLTVRREQPNRGAGRVLRHPHHDWKGPSEQMTRRTPLNKIPRTFLALAFVIMARMTFADTIHVPGHYKTIQAAIDAAQEGDEILVGPGRWRANDGASVVVDLRGKVITLRSKEGPEVTFLDGANRHRVVQALGGETEDTIVEGFTITRGKSLIGAGVYVEYGRPTFKRCHFTRNVAVQEGGALYSWRGSPGMNSCIFTGNVSGNAGSCVYLDGGSAWLGECDFVKNTVRGGGKTLDVDIALLTGGPIGEEAAQCTSPDEQGTVVFGREDGLVLSNCRFTSNQMHGARALRKTTLEVPDFVSPALFELCGNGDSPSGRRLNGSVTVTAVGRCGVNAGGTSGCSRPSRGCSGVRRVPVRRGASCRP